MDKAVLERIAADLRAGRTPELAPEDNGYYRSSCSFQGLVPGTYMLERDGQLAATVTVTAEEPEYMVVLGGEK